MSTIEFSLSDFDYDLPDELIAQNPANERTSSRLMVLQPDGSLTHHLFKEMIHFLRPQDLLVFNNTKVMKARLFGHKESGGKIELLVERVLTEVGENQAWVHLRASHMPKVNTTFFVGKYQVQVLERQAGLCRLLSSDSWFDMMENGGELPLPPYMQKKPQASDDIRYQTVYASQLGAVAAPTAGLHFDEELMKMIRQKQVGLGFVTLHVGAGTFQPIKTEDISQHKMHQEWFSVDDDLVKLIRETKHGGGRVIAVGTTALRALESMARLSCQKDTSDLLSGLTAVKGMTDLFIRPGFSFSVVDVLITNFHLPKSSLLLLVSAFSGYHRIRELYELGIKERYRFFSYGDAMWLPRMADKMA
jgi:S-adenosylmethionine:tRNA ribosyltransferase-isomerase